MTAAAAVIDAARVGDPFTHSRARVAAVLPLLVDAGDEEDLVVHREAEHDCEDHDGDERIDRSGLDAERACEPAALEDRLHDAERRGDREQIHECGLHRNQQRAEDDQQE